MHRNRRYRRLDRYHDPGDRSTAGPVWARKAKRDGPKSSVAQVVVSFGIMIHHRLSRFYLHNLANPLEHCAFIYRDIQGASLVEKANRSVPYLSGSVPRNPQSLNAQDGSRRKASKPNLPRRKGGALPCRGWKDCQRGRAHRPSTRWIGHIDRREKSMEGFA